ncbi:MAG: hypothetical protein GY719_24285 [bacterium]|nr:hypothetical protein [bacterium]
MTQVAAPLEYRLAGTLGAGDFDHALRGLAMVSVMHVVAPTEPTPFNLLHAVGDSRVAVYGRERQVRSWPTSKDGYSVAVDDTVWVGEAGQIEIFDPLGRLIDTWRDDDLLGLVTAIGITRESVFVADAAARCIRHFDRERNLLNNIGDRHRKGGFDIPNGVVDFVLGRGRGRGSRWVVHVANPGMHRVERYTPDGELLGRFGRFDGVDPEGFPGCCNPTNVTLTSSGRVVVTEKAPPRVKIYDSEGQLLTVVAADEAFDPAAKNMDVATGFMDRIYVADTAGRQICVFERTEKQS